MVELAKGLEVTSNLRLVRLLGEGAMGAVWVAQHSGLATEVAIKFIARDHRHKNREAVLARFEREARAAAQIKSPHVVHMYDHGVMPGGTPYIVMELLEGESLGVRLRRDGTLPLADVKEVVVQACRALSRAHDLGIVHRDIKPDNIFLVPNEEGFFVKVLDFGIAKHMEDPNEAVTTTGAMLGTPLYMSPELVKSAREADPRADLWALSVVAYEAITGKPPFAGETVGALFFSICGDAVDPPSMRRSGVPRALDAWFSRALCQEPSKRFGSARDMARALSEALSGGDDVQVDTPVAAAVTASAPEAAQLATSEFLSREGLAVASGAEARAEPAVSAKTRPPGGDSTFDGASASRDQVQAAVRAPRRRRLFLPLALGAAGLVGAVGYLSLSGTASPPPAPAVLDGPTPAPPASAPLYLRCDPVCDAVEIDGKRHRRDDFAVLARDHGEEPNAEELRIKLDVGVHRVALEKRGFVTRTEDVRMEPGESRVVRFELDKKRGKLPEGMAAKLLASLGPKITMCYEVALARVPSLKGKLEARIEVAPDGTVDGVALSKGFGDAAFRRCVEQCYKLLEFPVPEGEGYVEVTHAMELMPHKEAPVTPTSTSKKSRMNKLPTSSNSYSPKEQMQQQAPEPQEQVQEKK